MTGSNGKPLHLRLRFRKRRADHFLPLFGIGVEVQGGGADVGMAEFVPDIGQRYLLVIGEVTAIAMAQPMGRGLAQFAGQAGIGVAAVVESIHHLLEEGCQDLVEAGRGQVLTPGRVTQARDQRGLLWQEVEMGGQAPEPQIGLQFFNKYGGQRGLAFLAVFSDHFQEIMRAGIVFQAFDVAVTGGGQFMDAQPRVERKPQDIQRPPGGREVRGVRRNLGFGIGKDGLHLRQGEGPVSRLEPGLGKLDAGNPVKIVVLEVLLLHEPVQARANHGLGVIDAPRGQHQGGLHRSWVCVRWSGPGFSGAGT